MSVAPFAIADTIKRFSDGRARVITALFRDRGPVQPGGRNVLRFSFCCPPFIGARTEVTGKSIGILKRERKSDAGRWHHSPGGAMVRKTFITRRRPASPRTVVGGRSCFVQIREMNIAVGRVIKSRRKRGPVSRKTRRVEPGKRLARRPKFRYKKRHVADRTRICDSWTAPPTGTRKMNNTILSIAIGVLFFLTLSHSNANVCTVSENNLNACRKTSQELATTSNDTDQRKFNPISSYYIKDTYRTGNLNVGPEIRRVRVDGKEQERWSRVRVDDIRRVRLTRSESLPDVDVRRERVRNARERDVMFRTETADRRALERNDRRFLENRFDERTFRREVRDGRHERQTTRDGTDARRRTAYVRQNYMVAAKDKDDSTSWPFSNFVQSTIGMLGLYYFGMHNKSAK